MKYLLSLILFMGLSLSAMASTAPKLIKEGSIISKGRVTVVTIKADGSMKGWDGVKLLVEAKWPIRMKKLMKIEHIYPRGVFKVYWDVSRALNTDVPWAQKKIGNNFYTVHANTGKLVLHNKNGPANEEGDFYIRGKRILDVEEWIKKGGKQGIFPASYMDELKERVLENIDAARYLIAVQQAGSYSIPDIMLHSSESVAGGFKFVFFSKSQNARRESTGHLLRYYSVTMNYEGEVASLNGNPTTRSFTSSSSKILERDETGRPIKIDFIEIGNELESSSDYYRVYLKEDYYFSELHRIDGPAYTYRSPRGYYWTIAGVSYKHTYDDSTWYPNFNNKEEAKEAWLVAGGTEDGWTATE